MSIQEHLNKIRNAIKGSEVRESIAKGIETAYDDASEKNNANMEVNIARGTNPNLNTRLNKMDETDIQNTEKIDSNHQEVTAQLAQKTDKGNVSVNDINKNLGKFDQTYMSDELLQQMAGDTPIHAVPATESITNDKLTPKAVDYYNTTFLEIGKNLFDKEGVTIDHLIGDDGQVVESKNYYYSDYISVQPSTSYVRKFSKMINYYDISKQWIGSEPATNSFTTPENCKFVRLNGGRSELDYEQLEEGDQSTQYEPYGIKMTNWGENSIPASAIGKNTITPNETSFMSEGNIFVEWIDNKGISLVTGGIISYPGFKITEIRQRIEPDTSYYFSHSVGKAFYRDDGTFIEYVSADSGIIKTPTDASFIALVGNMSVNTDELVFIKSDSPVSYFDAFSKILPEHLPDFSDTSKSKWYGKTANFLGDSITEGYGLPTPRRPYPEYVKEILGLAEVRNYGITGSTIANKFQPMSERYVDMSDDVDLIVVFGGTNDYGMHATELGLFSDRTNTTFYGALHVLIEGLIKKYPTKDIVFITPIHRQFAIDQPTDDKTLNVHGYELKDYRDAIDEVTEYYGVPVIDLFHSAGMNPNIPEQKNVYFQDIAHPNEVGHERLGQKISTGLLKI